MENLTDKITAKLNDMRRYLQADGGDLEIVSIEDKLVRLKLRGACGGCPHATMTIKTVSNGFCVKKSTRKSPSNGFCKAT